MTRQLPGGLVLVAVLVLVATGPPISEPSSSSELAAFQTPSRIVSVIPAVTEMLFAMGAGDAVVAVSSFDRFPPEVTSLPQVGALIDPDVEQMLALRPDLVVVYATQTDLIVRLERAGIPMFRYAHAGLSDITATIRELGARIGRAADADRLAAGIEDDLEDIRQAVGGRPRPSTLLIFGREAGTLRGLFASGGVGFLHDMLEVAGGTNVFADVERQGVQLSSETVLARAPEVIVEVHPAEGWSRERIARERLVWLALPAVPAVASDRVAILADDRLAIPGPRVAEAVRLLAGAIHPEIRTSGPPGTRNLNLAHVFREP